ncbi:hypothetical protein PHMEG_00030269 [Phytophthora megakarya]|uniref:Retrotransposon gag domain-containing protein n=1 Tax=Phytophthora megakarya TaxID=4795 RepID=A0A225V0P7_9STRA|nr:hypothetical protein PHMEG_00030269 [Phytophthora megakarya]
MDELSVGSPDTTATHVEALQRLSTVIDEAAVATMLRTLPPTEQHGVALGFILIEQREVAAANTVSPGVTPAECLHVSIYEGKEGETLLRWLVELDTAIMARRIVDPLSKVNFAMSCLGGRARSWAYGCRLADPTCFSTHASFKKELKLAFEPRRMSSGRELSFSTCSRVSNVVTNPIDETTKVITFMKGLKDGPLKTYIFGEYPSTLEAAITLAMQEEFSLGQAKLHVKVPLPPEPGVEEVDEVEGPEPMDFSSATAAGQSLAQYGQNARSSWRLLSGTAQRFRGDTHYLSSWSQSPWRTKRLASTGRVVDVLLRFGRVIESFMEVMNIEMTEAVRQWSEQSENERKERVTFFREIVNDELRMVEAIGDESQQMELLTLLKHD